MRAHRILCGFVDMACLYFLMFLTKIVVFFEFDAKGVFGPLFCAFFCVCQLVLVLCGLSWHSWGPCVAKTSCVYE